MSAENQAQELLSAAVDIMREAREVLVSVYVTDFTQEAFKEFQDTFLRAEYSGQTVIPVYIDSTGGEVNTLFSMIDMFKSSALPVATVAIGRAQSCGADLLAAGTKGYRYASPLSVIMVHEGEGGFVGNIGSIRSHAKEEIRQVDTSFAMLDKHCEKHSGFWSDLLSGAGNGDLFMTAEEAKGHGLVDFVRLPRFEPEIVVKTKIA